MPSTIEMDIPASHILARHDKVNRVNHLFKARFMWDERFGERFLFVGIVVMLVKFEQGGRDSVHLNLRCEHSRKRKG